MPTHSVEQPVKTTISIEEDDGVDAIFIGCSDVPQLMIGYRTGWESELQVRVYPAGAWAPTLTRSTVSLESEPEPHLEPEDRTVITDTDSGVTVSLGGQRCDAHIDIAWPNGQMLPQVEIRDSSDDDDQPALKKHVEIIKRPAKQ
ncbi:hypothetical protein SAMN05216388_102616 [Halorientalis persicus]|uniref:Uncharacterized protein n=1 Tax=Halorientalis persicus TaxID=1367881 RepID=A0A1H8U7X0_9EURY|nr:hypothetical protein [Halorientalis persicus]SEO99299.1 hypothetical protein SAMN05216388_102616 [Halorientalis persicus]